MRFYSFFLALLLIPSVRVALFKEAPKIAVEGELLYLRTGETRPTPHTIDNAVQIAVTDEGFAVGEDRFDYPFIRIGSQNETLIINGKNFHGEVEIRRSGNNRLLVLNELPLEDYLVGLVHGEINANWPPEAIKAQVVAARTYALMRQEQRQKKTGNIYDLETDIADQVYAGSMGEIADKKVKSAVDATRGEVLWYLGYYPAYFHSCCGGQTELAGRVWANKDTSSSVSDNFCKNSPYYRWELVMPQKKFLRTMKEHGLTGRRIESIQLERYENAPRNVLVILQTDETTLFMGATDLRRILGYKELKSAWFDVEWTPREISFIGTGYGHGVGLCQWGAKAMAENGKDYKEILHHYYPKAIIRKAY